jgi:hypothetical protein
MERDRAGELGRSVGEASRHGHAGSGRHPGTIRPGSWSGPGPKASLALLVGALVTVVGLGSGFLSPNRPAVAGLSPSATPASAATASALDTPIGTPRPAATTAHPFTMPPAPALPPGVILANDDVIESVLWSPKGDRIAVVDDVAGQTPVTRILDALGKVEDEFAAVEFAWLDDDTYVAMDIDYQSWAGTPGPDMTGSLSVLTGRVGDEARRTVDGHYWAIVPGPGAAALKLGDTTGDQYVVITSAGVSSPRDGLPLAFSPDGSLIAVLHDWSGCCSPAILVNPTPDLAPPTLDVVRTDTGESLSTNDRIEVGESADLGKTAFLAFSPDSEKIAFMMDVDQGSPQKAGVLEIATGKLWVVSEGFAGDGPIDTSGYHPFLWTGDSDLVIKTWASGSAPTAVPVVVSYGDSTAVVSRTGRMARLSDDRSSVILNSQDKLTVIPLPLSVLNHQPVEAQELLWSPDGTALLVLCIDDAFWPGTYELFLIKP